MSNNELSGYISRIQNLTEEKKGLMADISEIYKEAKEKGYDPKIIREVLKRQWMTEHEIRERDRLIQEYEAAMGDLSGSPLADAARPR